MSDCLEYDYVVDRDIASGQEICNRGDETYLINARSKFGRQVLTYRGTPEKHSYWLSSRTVGQLCCRPHVVVQLTAR